MEAESSDDDQPLSIPTQPSQLPTRSGLEVYIARVEPAETKWIPLFFDGSANSNVKHIVSDGEGGYGCEVSERVAFKMTETISDLSSFDGVYAKRLRKRYQAENASYNTFTKKRALYAASNCTTKDTHFYWETGNGYASSLLNHIVGYVKFCKTGTDRLEDKATRKTTKRVPMEPPYAKRSKPLLKAVASTALLLPDTNPYWPTSREDRLAAYCGNMISLVTYARQKHAKTGGMSTKQVRNWLRKNPDYVPKWLQGTDFEVDHIVSDKLGGLPWPHNYFLMPKPINKHFGEWVDAEKARYVGDDAWQGASSFARWIRNKVRAVVDFSEFNPVGAQFVGRAFS